MANVVREQRHTRNSPCPICGGYDEAPRGEGRRCGGYTSPDGLYTRCSREELAGALTPDDVGLYRHRNRDLCHCGQRHGPDSPRKAKAEPEATYDYVDEAGDLIFRVVRFPGKQFRQCVPDGAGGWIWKINGARRVLYRLPELIGGEDPVYVVEGEKDADTLRALGLTATTTSGGAGKWRMTDVSPLLGRKIIIVADADDVGRQHAKTLGAYLSASQILESPIAKDISDHLAAGGTIASLVPMTDKSAPASTVRPTITMTPAPRPGDTPLLDGYPRTDMGNAERLVAAAGADLRYVRTWDRWLAWDGRLWADDGGAVYRQAKAMVRSMQAEALKIPDLDARTHALKYALKCEGKGPIEAMVSLARHDLTVAVAHHRLDADRMAINVANGTLDLRTGALRPHDRDALCTRATPAAYDPSAKCPEWDAFLLRVMGGDSGMVGYLQRLAGYAMTGDIREHALFFLYGSGANGKSTFLRTLHAVLGNYAAPAPRGLLFRSKTESHPTDLATLHGKRFVTCSEIEEGQSFDEALVKDLTGGDPVSARRMREDFWSFDPTHKLFIAGNHKPIIRGDDGGIWRRMRLVPWLVSLPEAEQDKTLPAKLWAEATGILAWCVRGCIEWQKVGLSDPHAVRDATAEYRAESDALSDYFGLYVRFESEAQMPRRDLRESYEAWCKESGLEPLGARRFAARLRERGVDGQNMRSGMGKWVNGWKGVRFTTEPERAALGTWVDRGHRSPVSAKNEPLCANRDEVPNKYPSTQQDEAPFADWVDEVIDK